MSLGIEFRNCVMNLNISREKAIIGETLAIESIFLEILQNKIIAKEENLSLWCDVSKKEMLVWFSSYDEKEIPKSQVFNLILLMSKVFGEHKGLRFLSWCANYEIKTYFDGVSFHFKNDFVHRNSDILIKGLKIKYCNCHFYETFLNSS